MLFSLRRTHLQKKLFQKNRRPNAASQFLLLAMILSTLLYTSSALSETHVFIVQGIAGEEYYQRHFDEQVEQLTEVSKKLNPENPAQIFTGDLARKETIFEKLDESIDNLFSSEKNATTENQLLIYLIGHGSYDGRDYKFNLAGPDITGTDLFTSLTKQQSGSIVLLNTSSSSGALLDMFKETGVNVLTATKSGAERTATRFGRHLAIGLTSGEADLNKNQSISLQEAFDFAVRETENFYDSEGLLATENARLQPAHDSTSSPDLIKLANLIEQKNTTDPKLIELYSQRDGLDRQIDSLRLRRTSMVEEDYLSQFQNLMIELSILQFEIDDIEIDDIRGEQ